MSTTPAPAAPERPMPVITRESQPYWDGMREHKLMLQHCASCGKVRHYPRPVCPHCFSMENKWEEAPLTGRIHTWTVCYHPFNFFFKAEAPYIVALIDMDGGVRINAPLRGTPADRLKIGQRARLQFEPVSKDVTLPYFVVD